MPRLPSILLGLCLLPVCAGACAPARAADAVLVEELAAVARTLGAVHYLHRLCGEAQSQRWRTRTMDLLAAAPPAPQIRDRLIAAFNAGYAEQQRTHRRCTPAAANLANTFARKGAGQAQSLLGRLGGES